jgi:quinol monooxygenase YgiN
MDAKQLIVLSASVIASSLGGRAIADGAHDPYVRVAEIEVDPVQLEVYKAAAKEIIEDSVRLEPGVLALYSVSDKDNPAHVTVFEIYADNDAYKTHLETVISRNTRPRRRAWSDPSSFGTPCRLRSGRSQNELAHLLNYE